ARPRAAWNTSGPRRLGQRPTINPRRPRRFRQPPAAAIFCGERRMPSNDPIVDFAHAVAAELGADAITLGDDVLGRYGEHTLPGPDQRPGAVAYPDSTAAVQTLVRLANRYRVQLYPISNGQNIGLGTRSPIRAGQVVVDLGRRMNRILEV